MPRPKKAGAPEPKRRSRTGCWPCKTRKVKCDEARPICVNCQRQGETCDYNIRLNWEGRGKKKGDSPTTPGFGQMNFFSGMGNVGTNNGNPVPARRTSSQVEFQAVPQHIQPVDAYKQTALDLSNIQISRGQQSTTALEAPRAQSEMMIDPALFVTNSTPTYQSPSFAPSRPDYQPTQSYERHRSLAPNTPNPAQRPVISRLRQNYEDSVPSPTDSVVQSPSASTFSNRSATLPNVESPTSTPPFYSSGKDDVGASGTESLPYDRPNKRARYQINQAASPSYDPSMPPPNLAPFGTHTLETPNISSSNNSADTPLTPASNRSDDGRKRYGSKLSPLPTQDSQDLRRLSVESLLSGPPGIPQQSRMTSNPEEPTWREQYQDVYQGMTTWGIDRGFKDLDIGKNDDANAISGSSPITLKDHLDLVLNEDGGSPVEFGFGTESHDTAFENGGYYERPVAICIPQVLEPLPNKLLENPMNLLYFHHFLNHTAGCLIPHNCSSNPFRTILPRMAVQDDDLLCLLLAYSASHRARLLRQPEPATRIALWVQDIFPNLRRALDDPSETIPDTSLASAIMLASLEIVSPVAFGIAVPWQRHLDTARQIIAARGGPQGMRSAARGDKVASFLWSWFAYLDVLGSLSGVTTNPATSSWILDYEARDETDYEIDCILGFTSRCVRLLSKIAELARICDNQRIGPNLTIQPDWRPSDETVARADKLETELVASRLHPAKPCTHMQSTGEAAYQWDSIEMAATNEAFHWAGLVHLYRRILGKPSTHPDVQNAVREIHGALYKVRRGSSATACLLFPIFTAGCDTQDDKQRVDILERLKGVEHFGMTQVHKARMLMERAWETGKPWETLVAGEFFG